MKKNILFLVAFTILSAAVSMVSAAGPASLSFSPAGGSYFVGQTFTISVAYNPADQTIDTIRARINFPADLLEVSSFALNQNFSFQAGQNIMANDSGLLSYGAGIPRGTSQPGIFGTIVFQVKKAGEAKVSIDANSLMLSDGENKFNGVGSIAVFSLAAVEEKKPVVQSSSPVAIPKKQVIKQDSPDPALTELSISLVEQATSTEEVSEQQFEESDLLAAVSIEAKQETSSKIDKFKQKIIWTGVIILFLLSLAGGVTAYKMAKK